MRADLPSEKINNSKPAVKYDLVIIHPAVELSFALTAQRYLTQLVTFGQALDDIYVHMRKVIYRLFKVKVFSVLERQRVAAALLENIK